MDFPDDGEEPLSTLEGLLAFGGGPVETRPGAPRPLRPILGGGFWNEDVS